MTRIWITQWAFDYRDAGVIAVDVPDELLPGDGRLLRLPREILKPWRWPNILFHEEVHRWHRSESEAQRAVKKEIQRRIRKAKKDLEGAQRHMIAFKAGGMPMAQTIAEKKAARRARAVRLVSRAQLVSQTDEEESHVDQTG